MESKSLDISWGVLWRLFFMLLFGWILFLARDVVMVLLLAIVISTAFNPIVTFLQKKRLPRVIGALLIYLVAFFLVAVTIYAIIPIALSELSHLLSFSDNLLGPISTIFKVESVIDELSINFEKITDLLFSGQISLIDLASKFLGGLVSAVTVFALSFYLVLGKDGVEKFLIAILPTAYEAKAINIYERVSRKIGRWLTGQLFLSLIIGLAVFLGLWLLGVKYSLVIGILAAILELIPYVGPIFTGAIATLAALGQSLSLGLYTFILFVVIQQLEGHVLGPLVAKYTTTLNPVVILVALLIGGKVFGVIGLSLAVPAAVLFQEVVNHWTETKQSRRGLGL